MDAGNMLKPMLARGELHCIGATTLDEYRKHVEKDAALERRFQPVMVNRAKASEDTISILRGLARALRNSIMAYASRTPPLWPPRSFPIAHISDPIPADKAIDLIERSGRQAPH